MPSAVALLCEQRSSLLKTLSSAVAFGGDHGLIFYGEVVSVWESPRGPNFDAKATIVIPLIVVIFFEI